VTTSPTAVAVHVARWDQLPPLTLHDLVKLRIDVFVVEQACPYRELDGRDVEEGTEHVWTADATGPTAYLRVLPQGDGIRIGRVCTRADARGQGLAAAMIGDVLARHRGRTAVLDAQAHLAGWYARLGFAVCGEEFLEDGMPHVPMSRPA